MPDHDGSVLHSPHKPCPVLSCPTLPHQPSVAQELISLLIPQQNPAHPSVLPSAADVQRSPTPVWLTLISVQYVPVCPLIQRGLNSKPQPNVLDRSLPAQQRCHPKALYLVSVPPWEWFALHQGHLPHQKQLPRGFQTECQVQCADTGQRAMSRFLDCWLANLHRAADTPVHISHRTPSSVCRT